MENKLQAAWLLYNIRSEDYLTNGLPQVGDHIIILYDDDAPIYSGVAYPYENYSGDIYKTYKSLELGPSFIYRL